MKEWIRQLVIDWSLWFVCECPEARSFVSTAALADGACPH